MGVGGTFPLVVGSRVGKNPGERPRMKQLVLPHCPNLTSESEAGAPSTGLPGCGGCALLLHGLEGPEPVTMENLLAEVAGLLQAMLGYKLWV